MAKKVSAAKLSAADLDGIKNGVVGRVAKGVKGQQGAQPTPVGPHDKHVSVHSRNTIVARPDKVKGIEGIKKIAQGPAGKAKKGMR